MDFIVYVLVRMGKTLLWIYKLIIIKVSTIEYCLMPRLSTLAEWIISVIESGTEKPSATEYVQNNMVKANGHFGLLTSMIYRVNIFILFLY